MNIIASVTPAVELRARSAWLSTAPTSGSRTTRRSTLSRINPSTRDHHRDGRPAARLGPDRPASTTAPTCGCRTTRSNTVSRIDVTTGAFTATVTLPHGSGPWGLAFDGSNVWVTEPRHPTRCRGSTRSRRPSTERSRCRPVPVRTAWPTTGENIWVSNYGTSTVSKIDPVSATVDRDGGASRPEPARTASCSTDGSSGSPTPTRAR